MALAGWGLGELHSLWTEELWWQGGQKACSLCVPGQKRARTRRVSSRVDYGWFLWVVLVMPAVTFVHSACSTCSPQLFRAWCSGSWILPALICCSVAKLCPTLCDFLDFSTSGFLVLQHLPGFAQCSCALSQWCHSTVSSSIAPSLLPSIFPSIRVFSNESTICNGWPNIGTSASASVLPIQDWLPLGLSGLISLLSKGLSSLLQHHNSKASVLQHSIFFMVQLSHPNTTTRKTIALTKWIFVGKVMSLLFNMLSRFVIAFLPRSKHLLISWLQWPSAVILEPKKIKSATVSIFSPICFPWSDGTECHGLSVLNVEF